MIQQEVLIANEHVRIVRCTDPWGKVWGEVDVLHHLKMLRGYLTSEELAELAKAIEGEGDQSENS